VPRPPRTLAQQTAVLHNLSGRRGENEVVSKAVNISNVQNVTAVVTLRQINNVPVTALERLALEPGAERRGEGRHVAVLKLAQVTPEQHAREERSIAGVRTLAKQRAEGEARLLREGAAGKTAGDAPRTLRIERPKDVPWLNPPAPKAAAPMPERRPEAVPERRPDGKPLTPPPVERARPVDSAPTRSGPPPAQPAAPPPPPAKPATPPASVPAKPPEPPRTQAAPSREVVPRQPPPPPILPKHEDRPIPPHQPPPAPKPPATKPVPPPPAKEPPHKEEPKKK